MSETKNKEYSVICKDIAGYRGFYCVDIYGNVYSLPYMIISDKRSGYLTKFKKLKPKKSKRGYLYISLYKFGKSKNKYIHRLVADAFLENENSFKTVDHLDFDKENNHVSNLEWCTQQENYKRYIRTNNHFSDGKLVINNENGIYYKSINEAARCYGINRKTLSYRLNNNITEKFSLV